MTGTSQETFEETPYHDESWEIVGQPPQQVNFEPMPVTVLTGRSSMVDPMFADYGGRETQGEESFLHADEATRRGPEEEFKEPMVTMTEVDFAAKIAEAEQRGRTLAIEEAVDTKSAELEALRGRLGTALQDLSTQFEAELKAVEKRAVGVTLDLARKLTFETVEINPEYIIAVLREALHLSSGALIKQIRISPQDKEFIDVVGLDEKVLAESDHTWNFVADETVRAGVIVETSAGSIDLQLDKAWIRYKDRILKAVS